MSNPPLTDRDRAVLEFERTRWGHVGAKDAAIWELFGMTWVRYTQVLHWVAAQPEALEYDPAHVARLRRVIAARQAARVFRRVGRTS